MSKRKRATTPELSTSPDILSLTAYEANVVSNEPHLAVALNQRTQLGKSQAGLICMDGDIWVDRYGPICYFMRPLSHTFLGSPLCATDSIPHGVHRFDARLLLPRIPEFPQLHAPEEYGLENEGWDELPSDDEDMWFFRSEEAEEYRYKKRRKLNEDMRTVRLRQMAAQTGKNSDDLWGDSDEEVFTFPYKLCTPNILYPAR
jgi:hypothetical protein